MCSGESKVIVLYDLCLHLLPLLARLLLTFSRIDLRKGDKGTGKVFITSVLRLSRPSSDIFLS